MGELDSSLKHLSDLQRRMNRPFMGPGRRRRLAREADEVVNALSNAGWILESRVAQLKLPDAVMALMPLEETHDQRGLPHRLNHASITTGEIEAFGLIEPAEQPGDAFFIEDIGEGRLA